MKETENNSVFVETAEEQVQSRKAINLRIQKFLLLSCKIFEYTPKKNNPNGLKHSAASILFLDANECDRKTGQPIVQGSKPVLSAFVSDPNESVRALENKTVFDEVFVRISGNDNFVNVHDVLSPSEVEAYRAIMKELI